MNKTFHSVWNASKQAYVAAAETVSARGKPTSGVKVAAVLASLIGTLLGTVANAQTAPPANTLPTGGQVSAGQASISSSGANMVIQQSSARAALNWQTFSVGKDAQVQFQQPNAASVTFNRVLSADPSQIFGRISANGQVILTNPSGVYFAPGSRVDVGALVATTHSMSDADFMAGKSRFERSGSTGSVVNEGELKASLGGFIALLAPEVRNHGAVIAQMGTVALAAGEAVDLKFDSNNRLTSIRVEPSQIQALVDNRHAVQAPGGLVIISAQSMDRLVGGVIKNSGRIEANGLQQQGGRIMLSSSKRVENTGSIAANAATGNTSAESGPAGKIEISAPEVTNSGSITATATGTAQHSGGSLLVQATNFIQAAAGLIDLSAPTQGGSLTVQATGKVQLQGQVNASATQDNNTGTNASATQGGRVSIEAQGDIELNNATLDASGGQGGSIHLRAAAPAQAENPNPLPEPTDVPGQGRLAIMGNSTLSTRGRSSKGGNATLLGDHISLLDTTAIDATGGAGGGTVLVGGDWQGSHGVYQATSVNMTEGASINASATDNGNGGTVVLWSDIHNAQSLTSVNGSLTAKGGQYVGDGGKIETSGATLDVGAQLLVNAGAGPSGNAGTWLLDPYNYTISSTQAGTITGTLNTTNVTVDTSLNNSSYGSGGYSGDVGSITINSAIAKSGSAATTLTLNAAGKIDINAGISTTSGALNLVLNTGGGLGVVSGTLSLGSGSLTKQGNGALALTAANTYTGGSTVSGGLLGLYSNTAAGAGSIALAANTTLRLGRSVTEVANNLALTGAVTVDFDTNVEYLVVGGGGGGGGGNASEHGGGGGGAGGVVAGTLSVTSGALAASVGYGGTAGAWNTSAGGAGGASAFYGIDAWGGGGGAQYGRAATSGASGGGGAVSGTAAYRTGAAGIQGTSGGTASPGTFDRAGGGGGGAGSMGGSYSGTTGGSGGGGVLSAIAGANSYYGAGGGGGGSIGGAGGSGVGGSGGGYQVAGSTGAAGTGSGGGGGMGSGGSGATNGGAGGSGLVVARYLGGDAASGGTESTGTGTAAGYRVHTFTSTSTSSLTSGTLTLNASSAVLTGVISGSGSLTVNATGATIGLTGANTYTGTTTLSGTVNVGSGSTTGALGTGAITNNATLTINRSDALTIGGNISGSGSLTKQGTGTLTLTGTNVYSGATTISAGTLQVGDGSTTGTLGTAAVTNNGALVFNRSDDVSVANAISGNGTLTKSGDNTLTLTANGSYTGATTISGGTLVLSNNAPTRGTSGFNGAGALRIEPTANDFTSAFTTSGWTLASTLTGLTIGKASSADGTTDAAVTIANAINIAGPISVYGGNINVNADLTSTLAGASILFKASGNITTNASRTIRTNNGDLIFWSDSDNAAGGSIAVGDSNTFNTANGSTTQSTGGGRIVMAGGLDNGSNGGTASDGIPDGAASSSSTTSLSLGSTSAGTTVTTMVSGGGDILLRGSSSGGLGLSWNRVGSVNAGGGTVKIVGTSSYYHGVELGAYGGSMTIVAGGGSASSAAITVQGTSTVTLNASGFQTNGGSFQATGTGGITLTGTGSSSNVSAVNLAMDALAASGPITITAIGSSGLRYMGTLGKKSGTGVTASSSDITLTANTLTVNSSILADTIGTLTVEPFSNSFTSTLTWPVTSFTLASTVSGLTLGKSSNTADVTIGSATSIAGPIKIYGGTVTLNAALTTSDSATGDVLIKTSSLIGAGNVNLATGRDFTVDQSGSSLYFGSISGADATLTKAGAGTLSLMTNSSYTGGTTLSGGVLGLYRNAAVGTGTINLGASTTLRLGRAITEVANNISLTGSSTVDFDNEFDYLIVGGGGGGGSRFGGGGGGGGVREGSASATSGTLSLAVGAGGTGGPAGSGGGAGGASSLTIAGSTVTASGGLGGQRAGDGGTSGSPQSNAGSGNFYTGGDYYYGGSGGGAGSAATVRYVAGSGLVSWVTGVAYGGGGAGGAVLGSAQNNGTTPGGGADGVSGNNVGRAGTNGLGGGGGGGGITGVGGSDKAGGAGGSGTVVIRYLGSAPTTATGGTISYGTGADSGYTFQTFTSTGDNTLSFNRVAKLSGVISGASNLTLNALAGEIKLTGGNTMSGTTTLSGGTIRVGDASITGLLGTGPVVNNTTLTLDRSDDFTLPNNISGTGTLTKLQNNVATLTGTNSWSGTTTISAGTLRIGDGNDGGISGSLGTGNVVDNAALVFNRSDDVSVANAISGSGTLTKTGAGTLTLTANGSYTGATTISGGTLVLSNDAPTKGTSGFSGAGTLRIEPTSNDFTGAFSTSGWTFGSTLGGLTVGKASSADGSAVGTADVAVTIASAISIAGPITVYGGTVALNQNLITTGSTAAILAKASGSITAAASRTFQTNNGNLTFWSDSDGAAGGSIALGNTNTFNTANGSTTQSTGGGHITLAGGSATDANGLPTGFASSATGSGLAVGTSNLNSASFYSGGGNVLLKGKATATSGGNFGLDFWGGLTINSGSGEITLAGESAASYGVAFSRGGGTFNTVLSSAKTADTAISLTGTTTATSSHGLVFDNANTESLYATGGGAIAITGTGTGTGYGVWLQSTSVLAASGGITVNGGTAGVNVAAGGSVLGKSTANVTTSTSNISITADRLDLTDTTTSPATLTSDTTGTVAVQSLAASFSAAQTFGTGFVVSSSATGLTLGQSTNVQGITVSGAHNINGPIRIYGGALAINAALTTTNDAIHLTASGAVTQTQTAAITANKLALNGAGTFTLTNSNNSVGTLAGGSDAARLGSVSFSNAGALTIGAVNPTGIWSTGDVEIKTLTGDLTLSENITTSSTSATAVRLYADLDKNYSAADSGTAFYSGSGGNILVSGVPTITTGSGGRATLYTGSVAGSTGLTALVGYKSGRFRYASDETTTNFTAALGSGVYAVYRQQPSLAFSASTQTITYGDTPNLTGTVTGAVNGDQVQTFAVYDNAGTTAVNVNGRGFYDASATAYKLKLSSAATGLGYSVPATSVDLTVGKKTLTVTANDAAKFYTQNDAYAGVSYSGFVPGESASNLTGTVAITRAATGLDGANEVTGEMVGTYALTAAYTAGATDLYAANYTFAQPAVASQGQFTIVPVNQMLVKVTPTTAVYGAARSYAISSDPSYTTAPNSVTVANTAGINVGSTFTQTVNGTTVTGKVLGVDSVTKKITLGNLTGAFATDYVAVTTAISAASETTVTVASKEGIVVGQTITQTSGGQTATATVASISSTDNTLTLSGINGTFMPTANATATSGNVTAVTALTVSSLTSVSSTGNQFTYKDSADKTVTFTVSESASSNAATTGFYNVGTYGLTGAQVSTDAGIVITNGVKVVGNLTVTPKAVALSATKTYDGSQSLTGPAVTVTTGVGTETLTYSNAVANSKNVGSSNFITSMTLGSGSGTADQIGLASNYVLPTLNATNALVTITPKNLTLGASTKVYDGTSSVAGELAFSGLVGTDQLTVTAATASGTNVGTGYNVSSVTIGAASASILSNYTLLTQAITADQALTLTAVAGVTDKVSVTARALGIYASKVYDGNFTLSANDLSYRSISGLVDSGLVAGELAGFASATLAGKDVATVNNRVSAITLIDNGAFKASNYSLQGQSLAGALTGLAVSAGVNEAGVTKRVASISPSSVVSKVYDGTTSLANVSLTLDGVVAGESISLDTSSSTGGFTQASVGSGKSYNLSNVALRGATLANYEVVGFAGSNLSGNNGVITAKTLTVTGFDVAGKEYNGDNIASILNAGTLTGLVTVGGVTDVVTVSNTGATFDNANAGSNKTVTLNGLTIGGAAAANYVLATTPVTDTATITAKALTISGLAANAKTYDGSTSATANISNWGTVSTGITGEALTLNHGTASFDSANFGVGRTVTAIGYSLADGAGGLASNYLLATTPVTTTANVDKAALSISVSNVMKTYDGGTLATGTASVVGGTLHTNASNGNVQDSLSGGTFAFTDKNFGVGTKVVTVSGVALNDGNSGDNYTVTYVENTSSTINKAALAVMATAVTKTYDGTVIATGTGAVGALAGVGDVVNLAGSQVFTDKNFGLGNKTVRASGVTLKDSTNADMTGNYDITYVDHVASTVNKAALTVTANAVTKTYDGTLAAAGTGTAGVPVGTGDAVNSAGSQAFTDKNFGVGNRTVRASGVTIKDNTDADMTGNYDITYVDHVVSTINKAALTVTANAATKTYDGTLSATGTGTVGALGGAAASEVVNSAGTQAFTDKNFGLGNKTVRASGVTIKDSANVDVTNNYAIDYVDNTTSTIEQAALTVTATQVVKTYDGRLDAVGAGALGTLAGAGAGEMVRTIGTQAFTDKNHGVGNKTVRASGVTIKDSAQVDVTSNYRITYVDNTDSTVNKAELTVVGSSAANKAYDGSTVAAVTGGALVGVVNSEDVTLTEAGAFANKNVGTAKGVTTASTIGGGDASNYVLSQPTGLTAAITRQESVTWVGGSSVEWFDPNNWALTSNLNVKGAVPDLSNVAAVVIPAGAAVSFTDTPAGRSGAAAAGAVAINSLTASGARLNLSQGMLNVGSGGGTLSGYLQTGGALSSTGAFAVTDSFTQTAGTLQSTGPSAHISLTQSAGNLNWVNVTAGGDLTVDSAGGTSFGTTAVGGKLTSTTRGAGASGGVLQTGAITVKGDSRFIADTGTLQTAVLTNANDEFQGSVSFVRANAGSWLNADVKAKNNLTLGDVETEGDLKIKVGNNLVQDASNGQKIVVQGQTELDAGGTVVLNDPANQFINGVQVKAASYAISGDAQKDAAEAVAKAQSSLPASSAPGTGLSNAAAPPPLALATVSSASPSSTTSSNTASTTSTAATSNSSVLIDVKGGGGTAASVPITATVSLPSGTTVAGFSFDLPESVRTLAGNDSANTRATLPDGSALPAWLKLDTRTLRFEATAVPTGAFPLQVSLSIGGQRVTVVIFERAD